LNDVKFENIGQRVGLLGGTFDPVHFGHLAAGKSVQDALSLDTVIFIPAFQPPHKHHFSLSPFLTRTAMLELALSFCPDFQVSYLEGKRKGPSYTCDTLEDICKKASNDKTLFFITGVDAFLEIHTWKNYQSLLGFADLAVIARPPHNEKSIQPYIAKHFIEHQYDKDKNTWGSPCLRGEIHLVSMAPVDISSSIIRQKIKSGIGVEGLLPDVVASYAKKNKLYVR